MSAMLPMGCPLYFVPMAWAASSMKITCGPRVEELEKKLCEVTGAKYAVVVANGTAALKI